MATFVCWKSILKVCIVMDEAAVVHDNRMQKTSDFLAISNAEEEETGDHAFQHQACREAGAPSFEQNVTQAPLPATVPINEDAFPSLNAQIQLSQSLSFSAEEFHRADQSSHSLYEMQSSEGGGTHMMIVASQSENGQVLHVIPSSQPGMAQVIIPHGQHLDVTGSPDTSEEKNCDGGLQTVTVAALADNASTYILPPQTSLSGSKKTADGILEDAFPVSPQTSPPNTPAWAHRLRSCEKIGDSYRGYCSSETELESILTQHKQQTQSVWGTRQSPSPAKPATRLMWKSQYVPFDGIPFINAGSRAIVMECQYGPRRKGFTPRKAGEESISCQLYKATCPARIYIKKVQKFPEYRVPTDPKIDKKIIRMEQEKAFNMLKKNLIDAGGVLRWYVQLPTQQAHQYHEMEEICLPPSPFSMPSPEEEEEAVRDENCMLPSRLHPQVAEKIRELVSQGIEQVYAVRKQLRKFVERELFKPDEVPEKHNLSFFPTVNDIKNHIHEVQKNQRNGKIVCNSESVPAMLQWTTESGNVLTETVTVTFASPPNEESSPEKTLIKVESNQARELLYSQTAQLLSSLQPRVFTQLKGLQLQSSTDGAATVITMDSPPPRSASLPHSTGRQIISQPVLCQDHDLRVNFSQAQNNATVSVLEEQPGSEHGVVTVCQFITVGCIEDDDMIKADQSLLGDVQSIPAQSGGSYPALKNPEGTVCTGNVDQETKEQVGDEPIQRLPNGIHTRVCDDS
ncbi:calcium-responsive transcription factor isoform X2 [Varanus komodoensis]|uniref:calcium-responsive transcription factor isoform X2 n=1 Tax=Varanus komodoensis TaxID=61221 RepID=UPI001CF7EAA8|nr:calcium-responsive transcription factor isoform X2 [Varanus komodoensis]